MCALMLCRMQSKVSTQQGAVTAHVCKSATGGQ
jgi:hypothetical protein